MKIDIFHKNSKVLFFALIIFASLLFIGIETSYALPEPYMVKDINPGLGSSYYLGGLKTSININGVLYFIAIDYTHGSELWKSDGTEEGTVMVKDINPGSGDAFPVPSFYHNYQIMNINNTIFFWANDGVHGYELWKSDGTEGGTVMVKDINPGSGLGIYFESLIEMNNILYFTANDGVHGYELWKSDGTEGGTVIVKDINPGSIGSNPRYNTILNNHIYFISNESLWKSDGTEEGTVMVKDLYFDQYTLTSKLFNSGNFLYFFRGLELWKSDGTEEGTVMVKYINPGGINSPHISLPIAFNNIIYFVANDGIHGYELWKSDGTEEGTVMVKDINPVGDGPLYAGFYSIQEINDTVYFSANDGIHGYELWKSDGTEEGTVMVKDIRPGSNDNEYYNNSEPKYIMNINGILFFSATDNISGSEIWKSDGTEEGTIKLTNLPRQYNEDVIFTNVNDVLYFYTHDFDYGYELWKLTLDTTNPVINITGSPVMLVRQHSTYIDAGATAIDDIDGDLTANINVINNVNTAILGNYDVIYTVSDESGNTSTARRIVRVIRIVPGIGIPIDKPTEIPTKTDPKPPKPGMPVVEAYIPKP